MELQELTKRLEECSIKLKLADDDKRAELESLVDDYIRLVLLALPSFVPKSSKLKVDIIIW